MTSIFLQQQWLKIIRVTFFFLSTDVITVLIIAYFKAMWQQRGLIFY